MGILVFPSRAARLQAQMAMNFPKSGIRPGEVYSLDLPGSGDRGLRFGLVTMAHGGGHPTRGMGTGKQLSQLVTDAWLENALAGETGKMGKVQNGKSVQEITLAGTYATVYDALKAAARQVRVGQIVSTTWGRWLKRAAKKTAKGSKQALAIWEQVGSGARVANPDETSKATLRAFGDDLEAEAKPKRRRAKTARGKTRPRKTAKKPAARPAARKPKTRAAAKTKAPRRATRATRRRLNPDLSAYSRPVVIGGKSKRLSASGITVAQKANIVKRLFPGYTKADHKSAAAEMAKLHNQIVADHRRTWEQAYQAKYGKKPGPFDFRISGIGDDGISATAKDVLRSLAKEAQTTKDAYIAHAKAAGLRPKYEAHYLGEVG